MVLHRVLRDEEPVPDLAAGHAACHELEYLDLATSQGWLARFEQLLVTQQLAQHVNHFARHLRGKRSSALRNRSDQVDQVGEGHVFHDVAAGSRFDGRNHVLL